MFIKENFSALWLDDQSSIAESHSERFRDQLGLLHEFFYFHHNSLLISKKFRNLENNLIYAELEKLPWYLIFKLHVYSTHEHNEA